MTNEKIEYVSILPENDLPDGFRYPESFLKMAGVVPTEFYYPWYFLPPKSQAGTGTKENIAKWSQRNLIPFASYEAQDAYTACFDGEDRSGNPEIFEVDFEHKCVVRRVPNFDVWEREARAEAETWTVNEYLYKGD